MVGLKFESSRITAFNTREETEKRILLVLGLLDVNVLASELYTLAMKSDENNSVEINNVTFLLTFSSNK